MSSIDLPISLPSVWFKSVPCRYVQLTSFFFVLVCYFDQIVGPKHSYVPICWRENWVRRLYPKVFWLYNQIECFWGWKKTSGCKLDSWKYLLFSSCGIQRLLDEVRQFNLPQCQCDVCTDPFILLNHRLLLPSRSIQNGPYTALDSGKMTLDAFGRSVDQRHLIIKTNYLYEFLYTQCLTL